MQVAQPVGSGQERGALAGALRGASRARRADRLFAVVVLAMAGAIVLNRALLLLSILEDGLAALAAFGPAFIWTMTWNPVSQQFGVLPAIYGTIATSSIAVILAVPIGLGAAIF